MNEKNNFAYCEESKQGEAAFLARVIRYIMQKAGGSGAKQHSHRQNLQFRYTHI